MKILKQVTIIMFITLLGELINLLIPLPIPGSIYGLFLMFFALHFKLIKLSSVRDTSMFLIEVMPVMFIPPVVGLIDIWPEVKPIVVPALILCIVTTFIVMIASGKVTQIIIDKNNLKKKYLAKEEGEHYEGNC